VKRNDARRDFQSIQPVAHDARRSKPPTHLWRWIYSGVMAVVLAALASWPPWAEPGLFPSNTDARSPMLQPTAQPITGPVLAVTPPAYKQGIFIVSGAGFAPGDRVLLFAQLANAAFVPDSAQARESLTFLAEALVGADGRLYVPINPLWINIPSDLLPAIIVAYTPAGFVPSVTPINLYANTLATPAPGVPALPATPVPLRSPWEMGGYANGQLSGQQRANQTVNFPKCDQLYRGDDKSASARWNTQIDVPLHTHFYFVLTVAGSARLSVDGGVIIDEWRLGDRERTRKVYMHLMHGLHDVQLEYSRPRRGHCKLSLSWGLEYPDWCAIYRNNTDFTGEVLAFRNIDSTSRHDADRPLKTQKDPNQFLYIDWESNSAAPEISADNWSVDITRTIVVSESGYYKFALNVGDRDEARVFVDQSPVIDHWVNTLTWSPPYYMKADERYFVQVQFRDLGGPSMLHFIWSKLDWPN